jgi:hypothetical protein
MPDSRDFRGVFYVKGIPEIRFDEGMFHICYTIGTAEFEFVYRPNTFLKGVRLAMEAADKFHAGSGDVFAFKDKGEH